jgi:hypothetical protein
MYNESPPLAGRAASDRPYRPGPRTFSPVLKKARSASNRPSTITQTSRALSRFSVVLFIGIGATLAWQSCGGELVRAWAPSLGWLLPPSPSEELQAQLKPVAFDLAIMKRSVEQLASNQDQLARKQDQMTQAFAALQAAVRDINQNILALAPFAPKAGSKPAQPAAQ